MSKDTKPLVSDEKREELRREMTTMMYPSNPDMGGREFYRIGMGHQRRIDRAIDYMLEAQAAELARYRSLAQVLVDALARRGHMLSCSIYKPFAGRGGQLPCDCHHDSALAKAKAEFDLTPTTTLTK